MPRVKGQEGGRICDLFCASLSLVSWHWSVREITARSLEEWSDDPMWRHALYSVMHRQSVPSLLYAGQWSKTGLFVARLAEDGICPRCKEAPENLMHRLWYFRANEQYGVQLNSLVPTAVSFPDSLPHTLARRNPSGRLGRALPWKSSCVC